MVRCQAGPRGLVARNMYRSPTALDAGARLRIEAALKRPVDTVTPARRRSNALVEVVVDGDDVRVPSERRAEPHAGTAAPTRGPRGRTSPAPFSATSRWRSTCRARYTVAIPPRPISCRIS